MIKDGEVKAICGHCSKETEAVECNGGFLLARNDEDYPIIGLTADYSLVCGSCNRTDYYTQRPGTKDYVWVYTDIANPPAKKLAIKDNKLSAGNLEDLKQRIPVTPGEIGEIEPQYNGPSAEEIARGLKELL